jgi:hypothetical protein
MPTAKGGPKLTEAAFQRQVIKVAKLYGWRVVHYRAVKAVNRRGQVRHLTPVMGDAGGPDLLLGKDGRVWLLELKTDTGRLSAAQRAWQAALGDCYWVVRPADWGRLVDELRGPGT